MIRTQEFGLYANQEKLIKKINVQIDLNLYKN